MTRLLAFILLLLAQPVVAQEPILRAEMNRAEAIPGQTLSLRLTVLVPTFLPDSPVWPSYEAPNLLVRVASTGPVSERIDGATWSGVSRRYLIAPMLPGPVKLPAKEIAVTWTDPETNAPRRTTLVTDALTITGIVPAGAEGLDPFVAADALTLEQSVDGAPEGMAPGDSITRTVTATIEGTSPMFLPPLLPDHPIDGIRSYPDSPIFEETAERGDLRGTRTERVTLVAEGGGAGEAPAVALDWYNLGTGAVETARLPAIAVSVDGPPARSTMPEPRNWRAIGIAAAGGVIGLALLVSALRRLAPWLTTWVHRRRADWLASETRAWRVLRRAMAARDHARFRPALDTWVSRLPGVDPRGDPRVSAALAALGAARYGTATGGEAAGWRKLAGILTEWRRATRNKTPAAILPPLNPRM